jgi:predicted outer membrane repeat protein
MKNLAIIQKVLVLSLALVLCAGTVRATQAGEDAAPLGTIQDMINAAPDGGTVNIPAGTYSETLTVDKNLTLSGVSASLTILQPASENQRVIAVTTGHNLTLSHLRVTGGHPTAAGGGGVYMAAGGSLTLDTVKIDHNQATYGGGVYQEGTAGSVIASNCMISDNTASFSGGGVYTGGSATLSNTILANNTAANHGGGMHVGSGTASLTVGAVYGNHALNGNGGGVNVNNGLTIVGTTFYSNTAAGMGDASGSGGAVSQWNSDKTVSISGATFNINTAQVNGGAVYVRYSFLTLSTTTFTSNQVDSGATGVDTYGGGVYAGGGLDGSGLTFTSNSAKYLVGSNSSIGGGLYIQRPSTGASSISSSTFDGNFAWYGSAINSETTVQLNLTSSAFINNGSLTPGAYSGYGGGVNAYWVHGDQLLFQNNRALNYGGGIDASHIVLTNSRFINNTTSVSGGGIYAYDDFTGTNLLFAGNDSGSGAAISVETGPAVLKHITIARPARGTGSGVYVDAGGTLELKNSILSAYDVGIRALGTVTEDYNLFFNNGVDYDATGGGIIHFGTHNVALKDPLFAAPAAGDYHLRWHSPAIGLGTNLGVTSDLDGRLRISRWDSGAYQYYAITYLSIVRK